VEIVINTFLILLWESNVMTKCTCMKEDICRIENFQKEKEILRNFSAGHRVILNDREVFS
jgi:hypothetical protein